MNYPQTIIPEQIDRLCQRGGIASDDVKNRVKEWWTANASINIDYPVTGRYIWPVDASSGELIIEVDYVKKPNPIVYLINAWEVGN